MSNITVLEGLICPFDRDDVDTDQIIPARFLTSITKESIGKGLFADWAKDINFPLNKPDFKDASFLFVGRNFGCGSSREHAPWALLQNGFKVIVGKSFADIFYQNCFKNGILPLPISQEDHNLLSEFISNGKNEKVKLDLNNQTFSFGNKNIVFTIDPFSKNCLIKGINQMEYILSHLSKIQEWESKHP